MLFGAPADSGTTESKPNPTPDTLTLALVTLPSDGVWCPWEPEKSMWYDNAGKQCYFPSAERTQLFCVFARTNKPLHISFHKFGSGTVVMTAITALIV